MFSVNTLLLVPGVCRDAENQAALFSTNEAQSHVSELSGELETARATAREAQEQAAAATARLDAVKQEAVKEKAAKERHEDVSMKHLQHNTSCVEMAGLSHLLRSPAVSFVQPVVMQFGHANDHAHVCGSWRCAMVEGLLVHGMCLSCWFDRLLLD